MKFAHKLLITSTVVAVAIPVCFAFTSCSVIKKPTIIGRIPKTAYAGPNAGHNANFQCVMEWTEYRDNDFTDPVLVTYGHDNWFKKTDGKLFTIRHRHNSMVATVTFVDQTAIFASESFDIEFSFGVNRLNLTHQEIQDSGVISNITCTNQGAPTFDQNVGNVSIENTVPIINGNYDAFTALDAGYPEITIARLNDDFTFTSQSWMAALGKTEYYGFHIPIPDNWNIHWQGEYNPDSFSFKNLTISANFELKFVVPIIGGIDWSINIEYTLMNYSVIGAFSAPTGAFAKKQATSDDAIVGNYLQLTPDAITDWNPNNDLTADHHYNYTVTYTAGPDSTVPCPHNVRDYGWEQKSCWLGQQYNYGTANDNPLSHELAFQEMGLYIRSWQLSKVHTIEQVAVDWGTREANIYNGYNPGYNNQEQSPYSVNPGSQFLEFSYGCLSQTWTGCGNGYSQDPWGLKPSNQDNWYKDGFRTTQASSTTKYHPSNLNYWDILSGRGVPKNSAVPDGIPPTSGYGPYDWSDDCTGVQNVAWKHIRFNDNPTQGDDNPEYFYVQFNYCFKGLKIDDGNNDNYFRYDVSKMHYHDAPPPA